MNTYYLKRFRKRFQIRTDGEKFICYDMKNDKFIGMAWRGYGNAVYEGICEMLPFTELTKYLHKSRSRRYKKDFKPIK